MCTSILILRRIKIDLDRLAYPYHHGIHHFALKPGHPQGDAFQG